MQVFAFLLNATDDILSFDYIGTINSALDTIERTWQIITAVVMIIADIAVMVWANGGREAASDLHQWWDERIIPGVESAIAAVYLAGVRSRILWERLNSPLFITL